MPKEEQKIKKKLPKLSPEVMSTAKKQAQKALSDLAGIARTIKLPEFSFPEVGGKMIAVTHDYTKDREEAEIRRLTLEQLRSKKPEFDNPEFDSKRSVLKFAGKEIIITKSVPSRQFLICKTLFQSMASMRKVWSWDEMVESWNEDPENYGIEGGIKIYGPAKEINKKVAIETGIKDLLEVKTKSVCVNILYLKKPAKS